MASIFTKAVKEKLKARVAIDGPTGGGKTFTALQLARILAGPTGTIGVFDTENRSAAYYAPSPGQLAGTDPLERLNYWDPPYDFEHAPISPPYSPVMLAGLIKAGAIEVGPTGVLVVDSLTHFWSGEGGTLDMVDDASSRSGNSFTGWKEGSPAQRHLLDTIIHAPCHIVVTMRSKMSYIIEAVEKNGKTSQVPKKVGLAPEQRAGIEYEFTIVADMDLEHRLIVSKSRCALIADKVATIGRSAEVWETFAGWLDSGVERISFDQASALVDAMNTVTEPSDRAAVKTAFVAEFGKPTELTTDRAADAVAWVRGRVSRLAGTEGGDPSPPSSNAEEPAPEPAEPAQIDNKSSIPDNPQTMGDTAATPVGETLDAIEAKAAASKAKRSQQMDAHTPDPQPTVEALTPVPQDALDTPEPTLL